MSNLFVSNLFVSNLFAQLLKVKASFFMDHEGWFTIKVEDADGEVCEKTFRPLFVDDDESTIELCLIKFDEVLKDRDTITMSHSDRQQLAKKHFALGQEFEQWRIATVSRQAYTNLISTEILDDVIRLLVCNKRRYTIKILTHHTMLEIHKCPGLQ